MTTHSPQASVVLDEFVHDLLQFTHACGSPSQRELAKSAPAVIARHKDRIKVLRPLSVAGISDVMSRKRQRPQAWGWVAAYVLTCLHYVETTGVEPVFDGPADLQGWHVHYQAMRDRLDRLHLEPPATSEQPVPDEPSELFWQNMDDDALQTWVHSLRNKQSMAHRRYHDLFGQHGVDLLIAAEHGDADASCRLGILLLCHEYPAEARAWLVSAANAGDEAAQVLINAAPSRRDQMAAELAYEFTLPWRTAATTTCSASTASTS
ncbi:hypothetical protein [Actinomadura rubrisoli]|uniref:Sel1 repeat family protein n=1 Tax=Actinomadura rubrisoli TaxID=2530368 RepID=A0A4R4ZWU4_9ACTN|nr:hypothetical protein [Actinomadura rubrisoli]TDD62599.1 hypothetical protein E1298_44520 [Actinomadura rubrisoli]